MKTIKTRILKNCFGQIKQITSSKNMIEVVYLINDAKNDYFKSRNAGIFIAKAANKDKEREKFNNRLKLARENEKEVYRVLLPFVPDKLRGTMMYKSLEGKYIDF